MLAPTFRFTVKNECGQTIAASSITVKVRRKKKATDGSTTYESSAATVVSSGSTLANNNYLTGTTQDNTTDKYDEIDVEFKVTAPASANGNVILYFEVSVDGGTTWTSDGTNPSLGAIVCVLNFTTSGTKTRTFSM
jgi:hypothetical protein